MDENSKAQEAHPGAGGHATETSSSTPRKWTPEECDGAAPHASLPVFAPDSCSPLASPVAPLSDYKPPPLPLALQWEVGGVSFCLLLVGVKVGEDGEVIRVAV